ncbi:MAG TPA: hypothetical protein VFQ83_04445 [Candidatus Udaeobacter sp.]|nr:hypothetical protein [Candidatus Udaeobacter sp.]
MIAAVHIENLLFLLLVAVAALFQFLAKAAGRAAKNQTKRTSTSRNPPPIPRTPRGTDEDRIRKLMEALGQAPTSKPPPPVVPRTDVPPHPLVPVQPPLSPLAQLKREKPRKREATQTRNIPSITPPRLEKIVTPKPTAAPAFEILGKSSPIGPPPIISMVAGETQTEVKTQEFRTDVTMLLTSTSGLRNAILLREILGPPRGLQAIDSF